MEDAEVVDDLGGPHEHLVEKAGLALGRAVLEAVVDPDRKRYFLILSERWLSRDGE